MKKAIILAVLIAMAVPMFAAIVSSDELTSMYGVTYEERQRSNYIEKDGYSFQYIGDGKWEVTRLRGSSGSSSSMNMARNWISGEISILGVGARYDFQVNNSFSVGVTGFFNTLILWNAIGFQVAGRFYPGVMKNSFYAELGLGFGWVTGTESGDYIDWVYITRGLMVTPAIGWKLKFGSRPKGFFINPQLGVPIVFGKRTYDTWNDAEGEFKIGFHVRPAIGFGGAF